MPAAREEPITEIRPDAGAVAALRARSGRRSGLRHKLAEVLLDDAPAAFTDRPALRSDGGQWSYAELAARSSGAAAAR